MIISKGAAYRFGVRLKERGERMGHYGIPVLSWIGNLLIRLGLAIRDRASG